MQGGITMNIESLKAIALSIRSLSMEAIEKAKSGHPGLPLGCAEFGAVLYGNVLSHNPADPAWPNRDRFVLSAGHGSMFLYSLLHLSGYNLPLEELAKFRQLGSKTPGHPEYGWTPGVETTTGPLGQGFANAVGMALSEKMLAARFNTNQHKVINHYTYTLAGDGCMMEGISYEAASFAGHQKLGKLIAFYDSNRITIEGGTDLAFSENVALRFQAMNWQVQTVDAYDFAGIEKAIESAKTVADKPSLIIMTSIIGKGAPGKEGSHEVHGAPLGPETIAAARAALGLPQSGEMYVDPLAAKAMAARKAALAEVHEAWNTTLKAWRKANPELAKLWDQHFLAPGKDIAAALATIQAPQYEVGAQVSTRVASGKAINAIAPAMLSFIGGSADLSPSNNTDIKDGGHLLAANPTGRILHFGIREHAMGAITNGIMLHGGFRPFCATFLVFADYMRHTVRLAALMKLPVVYVFTHDSIHVGEDGPTHQPIEHVASLRIIPGMQVLRPGDAEETWEAWKMALAQNDGPTALILTRQNLPVYAKPEGWQQAMATRGAYVVHGPGDVYGNVSADSSRPTVSLIATGSEVSLALEVAKALEAENAGIHVRVVSVVSRELLEKADEHASNTLLGSDLRIVMEAGVKTGWEYIASNRDCLITLDEFGHSGTGKDVADHMGLSVPKVLQKVRDIIASQDW